VGLKLLGLLVDPVVELVHPDSPALVLADRSLSVAIRKNLVMNKMIIEAVVAKLVPTVMMMAVAMEL
jgi:hypothetical protein